MFTPIIEYTKKDSPWEFNVKDLDQDAFVARAKAEAQLIYNKPSTRKGRTLEKIIQTVLIGHAPEYYLIQFKHFKDDPRDYKDVIEPEGDPAEQKATSQSHYVPFVLERANVQYDIEKKLYIWVHNKTLDYYLAGIYVQSN